MEPTIRFVQVFEEKVRHKSCSNEQKSVNRILSWNKLFVSKGTIYITYLPTLHDSLYGESLLLQIYAVDETFIADVEQGGSEGKTVAQYDPGHTDAPHALETVQPLTALLGLWHLQSK